MSYLLLLIGLALLLVSANYLVDASIAIAKRAKVAPFIIGLTIVGIGTSAPELFVSISSAWTGHGDIALGNVLGSNIANLLLILGLTATICPFAIERETHRRDIPIGIAAAVLLTLFVNDRWSGLDENVLSRIDGAILLLIFFVYMGYMVFVKAKDPQGTMEEVEESTQAALDRFSHKPALLWSIAIVSLGALLWGGNIFLDAAVAIAQSLGMTEAVISITIVAVGTSLPELITAVVAARKGSVQLALGNVLGSNVFNIFMILGITSSIKPITATTVQAFDYLVLIGATIGVYITYFSFGKKRFDRSEGIIFLTAYVAYTAALLLR